MLISGARWPCGQRAGQRLRITRVRAYIPIQARAQVIPFLFCMGSAIFFTVIRCRQTFVLTFGALNHKRLYKFFKHSIWIAWKRYLAPSVDIWFWAQNQQISIEVHLRSCGWIESDSWKLPRSPLCLHPSHDRRYLLLGTRWQRLCTLFSGSSPSFPWHQDRRQHGWYTTGTLNKTANKTFCMSYFVT